jgi:tripartite-type tricarboxylate transporter receptor subunit TctC
MLFKTLVAASAIALAPAAALAQDSYPTRAVRIVVPQAAASGWPIASAPSWASRWWWRTGPAPTA